MRRSLDIETLRLSVGSHEAGADEMCVMEAVAYVAGEDWTDHPTSASRVIGAFLKGLNDAMNDVDRQGLKPLISGLPGSCGSVELETARSWMVMDWHCRTWPSVWLRSAGCVAEAVELEGAHLITDLETLHGALQALGKAREAASTRHRDVFNSCIDEGLGSAVTAADADGTDPALVAARAAITSGDTGLLAAARQHVPAAGRWDARRRAGWSDAWDAGVYRLAVVNQTGQIAAMRALSSSSAWDEGWNAARAGADQSWDLALAEARVAGRDAARAVAMEAAWTATRQADRPALWNAAMDAAEAALRAQTQVLQRSAIWFVASMVDAVARHGHR